MRVAPPGQFRRNSTVKSPAEFSPEMAFLLSIPESRRSAGGARRTRHCKHPRREAAVAVARLFEAGLETSRRVPGPARGRACAAPAWARRKAAALFPAHARLRALV